jgi:dTDP-4-amino-4,6-dideoxygalactose transaminase
MYKVPFIKPSFPGVGEIAEDYANIIKSNWFTNFGPYEKEFSKQAASFLGEGVFASTLGLFIAIKILFKSDAKRRKVLVPSFTFAAGPEMLILSGFIPVFIDIGKDSWQPDWEQAEKYIENNKDSVAGILLCNIFGVGNQSVQKWESLATSNNLPLIIDSAAGFGSMYNDTQNVGVRGDCEIFSLHATKPFAVGEGGFIVSKDEKFIDEVRSFENFGFNKEKKIGVIGINAKLQEFNAAIGLRQLKGFHSRLAKRRISLKRYKAQLALTKPVFQDNDHNSTVPFVSVLMETKDLASIVLNELNKSGIEARKYYEPLHNQILILKESEIAQNLINTEDVYSRILSLPLHDSMSNEDIDFISDVIVRTYEKYKS